MKRKTEAFFRSFRITLIILTCTLTFIIGISKAYTNIRLVGFGEYRNAIETENRNIKILDFEISF